MSPHAERTRILRVDAADLDADGGTLDALARLALIARRCGYLLIVQGASSELVDLIDFAGLSETLGVELLRG